MYFKSPTEIKQLSEIDKKKIRVGGMVKKDSINFEKESISFIITDFKNDITNRVYIFISWFIFLFTNFFVFTFRCK